MPSLSATVIELPSAQALQSDEQIKILDTIDSLRALGMEDFTPLPQLIVCGDQSSGKSSVLEAISGVPFPRKSGVCTRFATEVILRRSKMISMKVSITPSEDLPDQDQEPLPSFEHDLTSKDDFPDLFEKAKEAMGISDQGRSFSTSVLRVEFHGPQQPQLTLVDLPGLIHATSNRQKEDEIELVSKLVGKYLENPRSIILSVVSGTYDFNNQVITRLVRQIDPQGERTLGIITKPDLIRPEAIQMWLKLARNEEVKFKLGWHVVKNLELGVNDTLQETRDDQETEFFQNSDFSILPAQNTGINTLRTRLSRQLFYQIQTTLPTVMGDIERKIVETKAVRDKFGPSRSTITQQRNYLIQLSESFKAICSNAIGGHYDHDFFEKDLEKSKCLCANLYKKHADFANTLQEVGASWMSNDDDNDDDDDDDDDGDDDLEEMILDETHRTREQAIKEAYKLLKDKRGPELPGLPNPYVVGKLFRDYSRPWENIARKHIQEVWVATKRFIETVLYYLTDNDVCDKILIFWLDPLMEEALEIANGKLSELLEIHKDHPMTLNNDFVKNRKLLQEERSEQKTPNDMDMVAAEEAFDNMNAYYQVALKLFMDNVPNLAIRASIIKKVPSMLSPTAVSTLMDDETVAKIAGESKEKADKRLYTLRKLEKLEQGARICKEYRLRPISNSHLAEEPSNITTSQVSIPSRTEKGKTSESLSSRHNRSASEDGRGNAGDDQGTSESSARARSGNNLDIPKVTTTRRSSSIGKSSSNSGIFSSFQRIDPNLTTGGGLFSNLPSTSKPISSSSKSLFSSGSTPGAGFGATQSNGFGTTQSNVFGATQSNGSGAIPVSGFGFGGSPGSLFGSTSSAAGLGSGSPSSSPFGSLSGSTSGAKAGAGFGATSGAGFGSILSAAASDKSAQTRSQNSMFGNSIVPKTKQIWITRRSLAPLSASYEPFVEIVPESHQKFDDVILHFYSISSKPLFRDYSFEELRLADYSD